MLSGDVLPEALRPVYLFADNDRRRTGAATAAGWFVIRLESFMIV